MKEFYFEITDIFDGELNYCWLNRYIIKAKTFRDAITKLSRHTGLKIRKNGLYFKAKGYCIGAYELDYEMDESWIEKAEII